MSQKESSSSGKVKLCWLGIHRWDTYVENVRSDSNENRVIVLAWKQCPRCGKSKLVFVLT